MFFINIAKVAETIAILFINIVKFAKNIVKLFINIAKIAADLAMFLPGHGIIAKVTGGHFYVLCGLCFFYDPFLPLQKIM